MNGKFQIDHRRRGVALLLVMIGLVVCSILTAGFLMTQGTANGIARNERDAQKCRDVAQSGVDLCFWLIRNRSDWREAMTPGTWLSNYSVGDGAVTVTAVDGANNASFSTDPTQSVVLTSTGSYNNRVFTLTATIRPTGGGTVYGNGNFVQGSILLGNNDLLTQSIIDSYNSSAAAYNASSPGSNAFFSSNSTVSNSITIYSPSIYRGTFTGGANSFIGGLLDIFGSFSITPSSITASTENRVPGDVYAPNTTGLTTRAAVNNTAGTTNIFPQSGSIPSVSMTTSTTAISSSGTYFVSGAFTVGTGGVLRVNTGVNAVIVVNGALSIKGQIQLQGTGALTIYAGSAASLASGIVNSGGSTANFTLMGLPACNSIQLTGTASVTGAIFAPQASVAMASGSTRFYGALVAQNLSVTSTGQIHFDQALQSKYIGNIYNGSAPPGQADYRITITGGPGFPSH